MTPILDLAHATGCTWQLVDGKLRVSGTKAQRDAFRPLAGQVVALEIKRQSDALANAFAWFNAPSAPDAIDCDPTALALDLADPVAEQTGDDLVELLYLRDERLAVVAEGRGQ